MKTSKYSNERAFFDFLYIKLLSIAALFLIAVLFISPKKSEETLKRNAEYVVKINWQNGSDHDVDLWAYDMADDRMVGFMNKQIRHLYLERDDLGNDYSPNPELRDLNEEYIVFRGLPENGGRFIFNVHFYSKKNDTRMPEVTWQFYKINPTFSLLRQGKVLLNNMNEEKTILAFDIDRDKYITYIDGEHPFVLNRNK